MHCGSMKLLCNFLVVLLQSKCNKRQPVVYHTTRCSIMVRFSYKQLKYSYTLIVVVEKVTLAIVELVGSSKR